jgi:uncharacterized protein (TIGR03083 family)
MDSAVARGACIDLNRAFLADLETLPTEAWTRPSDCPGWSVAAAVVHLSQVADFLGDSLTRGRAGDPGPPARAAEGIQAWRDWRAAMLREALGQPPAELLARYRRAVAELERAFDGIDDAPPDARGWHPVGAHPFPWLVDQWLFELPNRSTST